MEKKKLYIISAGGTGTKLLRSIVHWSATGAYAMFGEIKVLIVDGDTDYSYTTLRKEIVWRNEFARNAGKELGIPIISPFDTGAAMESDQFKIHVFNNADGSVRTGANKIGGCFGYDYDNCDVDANYVIDSRFNNHERDLEQTGGFYQRPNIGAVVLDRLLQDTNTGSLGKIIETNLGLMSSDDVLFVIGGFYGGTGPAGIPAILRHCVEKNINNASMSLLTLTPSFKIIGGRTVTDNNFFTNMSVSLQQLADKSQEILGDNGNVFLIGEPHDYLQNAELCHYEGDAPSGSNQANLARPAEFYAATAPLFIASNRATTGQVYYGGVSLERNANQTMAYFGWAMLDGINVFDNLKSSVAFTHFLKVTLFYRVFIHNTIGVLNSGSWEKAYIEPHNEKEYIDSFVEWLRQVSSIKNNAGVIRTNDRVKLVDIDSILRWIKASDDKTSSISTGKEFDSLILGLKPGFMAGAWSSKFFSVASKYAERNPDIVAGDLFDILLLESENYKFEFTEDMSQTYTPYVYYNPNASALPGATGIWNTFTGESGGSGINISNHLTAFIKHFNEGINTLCFSSNVYAGKNTGDSPERPYDFVLTYPSKDSPMDIYSLLLMAYSQRENPNSPYRKFFNISSSAFRRWCAIWSLVIFKLNAETNRADNRYSDYPILNNIDISFDVLKVSNSQKRNLYDYLKNSYSGVSLLAQEHAGPQEIREIAVNVYLNGIVTKKYQIARIDIRSGINNIQLIPYNEFPAAFLKIMADYSMFNPAENEFSDPASYFANNNAERDRYKKRIFEHMTALKRLMDTDEENASHAIRNCINALIHSLNFVDNRNPADIEPKDYKVLRYLADSVVDNHNYPPQRSVHNPECYPLLDSLMKTDTIPEKVHFWCSSIINSSDFNKSANFADGLTYENVLLQGNVRSGSYNGIHVLTDEDVFTKHLALFKYDDFIDTTNNHASLIATEDKYRDTIENAKYHITLPLSEKLLEYYPIEEARERVSFQVKPRGESSVIIFKFRLTYLGGNEEFVVKREYIVCNFPDFDINQDGFYAVKMPKEQLPLVAIFPNFTCIDSQSGDNAIRKYSFLYMERDFAIGTTAHVIRASIFQGRRFNPETKQHVYRYINNNSITDKKLDGRNCELDQGALMGPTVLPKGFIAKYIDTDFYPELIGLGVKQGQPDFGFISLRKPVNIPKSEVHDDVIISIDFATTATVVGIKRSGKDTEEFAFQDPANQAASFPFISVLLSGKGTDMEGREKSNTGAVAQYLYPSDYKFDIKSYLTVLKKMNGTNEADFSSPFESRAILFYNNESLMTGEAFKGDHLNLYFKMDNVGGAGDVRHFLYQLVTLIYVKLLSNPANHYNSIKWHFSYPTSFSQANIDGYKNTVRFVFDKLEMGQYSIGGAARSDDSGHADFAPPWQGSPQRIKFYTESISAAAYVGAAIGAKHYVCFDVGGGSTDISINNEKGTIVQASINFASLQLFVSFFDEFMKNPDIKTKFASTPEIAGIINKQNDGSNNSNKNYRRFLSEILLYEQTAAVDKVCHDIIHTTGDDRNTLGKVQRGVFVGLCGMCYYVSLLIESVLNLTSDKVNSETYRTNFRIIEETAPENNIALRMKEFAEAQTITFAFCGRGARAFNWVYNYGMRDMVTKLEQQLAEKLGQIFGRSGVNVKIDLSCPQKPSKMETMGGMTVSKYDDTATSDILDVFFDGIDAVAVSRDNMGGRPEVVNRGLTINNTRYDNILDRNSRTRHYPNFAFASGKKDKMAQDGNTFIEFLAFYFNVISKSGEYENYLTFFNTNKLFEGVTEGDKSGYYKFLQIFNCINDRDYDYGEIPLFVALLSKLLGKIVTHTNELGMVKDEKYRDEFTKALSDISFGDGSNYAEADFSKYFDFDTPPTPVNNPTQPTPPPPPTPVPPPPVSNPTPPTPPTLECDKWKCSCGTENEADGVFCDECGSPKPEGGWTCSCGAKNEDDAVFCDECGKKHGAPLTCINPNCDFVFEEPKKFCKKCGTKQS
jgi:hypothetical protein